MMLLLCINRRLSTAGFTSFLELREKVQCYNRIQFNLHQVKNRLSYTYMIDLSRSPNICVCCGFVSDFFRIFGNLRMELIFLSRISILAASKPRAAIGQGNIIYIQPKSNNSLFMISNRQTSPTKNFFRLPSLIIDASRAKTSRPVILSLLENK